MRVLLFLLMFLNILFAEKIVIHLDFMIDDVGNAKLVWTQQASAAQWQILMQKYGNNPALLKREVVYSMPDMELTNFKFIKDEMNRKFQFIFEAKGVVVYRGKGKWQFPYEKKFTPRKINDRTWFFTHSESPAPGLIQEYDITVKLPQKAEKAHLDRNEFNEPILEYYLKPKITTAISWIAWTGFFFVFLGISFFLIYYRESKGVQKRDTV